MFFSRSASEEPPGDSVSSHSEYLQSRLTKFPQALQIAPSTTKRRQKPACKSSRGIHMNMQTPTIAQIRTAIEVLTKLGERLNTHAEHSVLQLAESPAGAHQAGRIEVSAIEQTTRIEAVAAQLKNWREEMLDKGGDVFLITLNEGQALPLATTRILRPRVGRGVSAEQPRNIIASRPLEFRVGEPELARHRAQLRVVQVREQSAIAFCPRPKTRRGTVFGHVQASASAIHEQAAAAPRTQPQPIRDFGQSTSITAPPTRTFHDSRLPTEVPTQHIRLSVSLPTQFPVHIHVIPVYGLN